MKKNCNQTCKKTSIGGQALIEGIMMRGPKMTAMAVRDPEGKIVLEKWRTPSSGKSKFKKLPLIRGIFGFISSMTTGYKSLMRSAEISGLEEAEEELRREKEAKKAAKKAKKTKEPQVSAEEPVTEETAATDTVTDGTSADDSVDAEKTVSDCATTAPNAENKTEAKKKSKEKKNDKKSSPLTNAVMVVAVVLAVILSVGLFMYLPAQIYEWCSPLLSFDFIADNTQRMLVNSFTKSAFEGILRIILLVGYMLAVSFMKDIRRTFMYHGAEHKTIFCYEHGMELTVENVRKEGRFHPRCGTSFLILMLIVGILVSFFIDPLFVLISGDPNILETKTYLALRVAVKLITVPLIMGIGYELIKFAGKHDNLVTRIISAPGMWLQHITVLEPTDDMIECAIAAFVEVIPEEEKKQSETAQASDVTAPEEESPTSEAENETLQSEAEETTEDQ